MRVGWIYATKAIATGNNVQCGKKHYCGGIVQNFLSRTVIRLRRQVAEYGAQSLYITDEGLEMGACTGRKKVEAAGVKPSVLDESDFT